MFIEVEFPNPNLARYPWGVKPQSIQNPEPPAPFGCEVAHGCMMLKPEAGRVLQLGSSGLAIATLPGAPSSLRRSTMATSAWSLRDVLAVIFIFVCFCFAWLVSMGREAQK